MALRFTPIVALEKVATADKAVTLNASFLNVARINPTVLTNLQLDTAATQPTTPPPVAPAEPVSAPTYDTATASFGTIRHVDPIHEHLVNTLNNIDQLRRFATHAAGVDKSLLERVEAYLKAHLGDSYQASLAEVGVSGSDTTTGTVGERLRARFFNRPTPKLGASKAISNDLVVAIDDKYLESLIEKQGSPSVGTTSFKQNTHSALFDSGTVLATDIRAMEALRSLLVKLRRQQQLDLEQRQAALAALDGRIREQRTALSGLEARRSETLDDFAVAQRLLAEHWQEVEQAYARRQRVIDSRLGLYYVRVRETPLSRTLPDPLALRSGSVDDLVPGCPVSAASLPAELQPFLDAVLDIPAAEWAVLEPLSHHLPGRVQLEQLVQLRRLRLDNKQAQAAGAMVQARLAPILQEQHEMVRTLAARPFSVGTLREMQQQGHRILALEDMLASPSPALREPAQKLQQQLNSCVNCLLAVLRGIAPSIRLDWADQADDNRLPVESPERWPALARAEAADFNTLRTLMELLAWWFRQLAASASGESRTAMRNVVRACLLLAASDDPQQLLQGQLKTLPPRLRLGELLRLDLNREPAPGNVLHLLDAKQDVVASVRVEDHDASGTLASITTILQPGAQLMLAMRVTGRRD